MPRSRETQGRLTYSAVTWRKGARRRENGHSRQMLRSFPAKLNLQSITKADEEGNRTVPTGYCAPTQARHPAPTAQSDRKSPSLNGRPYRGNTRARIWTVQREPEKRDINIARLEFPGPIPLEIPA